MWKKDSFIFHSRHCAYDIFVSFGRKKETNQIVQLWTDKSCWGKAKRKKKVSPFNTSLASRLASTEDAAQTTGSEAPWDNLLLTKNVVNLGRQNRWYTCLQIKRWGSTETSSCFMKGKSELSLWPHPKRSHKAHPKKFYINIFTSIFF